MRSLALVLTGVWLGALLASWAAATVNFRIADRVASASPRPELEEPQPRAPPGGSGAEPRSGVGPQGGAPGFTPGAQRRMSLRHLASEINRWSFRWWSRAQLVLGIVLVALCWARPGAARWLIAAAVAIVLAQLSLVRPIVDLGRSIDFVPRPLPADVARRFGMLHAAFVLSDLLKAGLLAAAAFALGRR